MRSRNPRTARRPLPAGASPAVSVDHDGHTWTFLTNHTHVLICLAGEPQPPLREVAAHVGITERSVQRIVADLETDGYLVRRREGRRNRYSIRRGTPLRHPIETHKRVGDLLAMILEV